MFGPMPRIAWQALSAFLLLLWILCEVQGFLMPWNGDEVIYQWGGVLCLGAGIGSWFERPKQGAIIALLVVFIIALFFAGLANWGLIAE